MLGAVRAPLLRVQDGANAIFTMRYGANETTNGITKVLAYKTAEIEPTRL